ncbi:hypothetical protein DCS_06350 [Drechmeria coniospora]|uniref:MARVEL domain-containing protein n=1 Tax=Drechmeria coniospora TaxID=98403 RepID=A0A151GBA4_DRECN|nr:hypothetical protein DCS_06350 [Drechmeria coniospora]KYK54392.1 hypothetical protein DCS_06350 [Drechmeria coniospora]ODA77323.1 hypothetical protein RJ55_06951 [Drechmeria coniospora]
MALGSAITLILYAVLGVFLIIELGLTSYVVSKTNIGGWWWSTTPSSIAFLLFCTIWSILILIYLVIAHIVEQLFHSLVALVLLVITTIFWFAGSIAVAAYIGVPHCSGDWCTPIQTAQAAVAFGFFIWIIFTVLTVFTGMSAFRGGARKTTGPPMPA